MADRYIAAGRRQTAVLRRRLRPLGPLALPVALLLTLPGWTLVPVVVAGAAVWRQHPAACTLLVLLGAGVGLALGEILLG